MCNMVFWIVACITASMTLVVNPITQNEGAVLFTLQALVDGDILSTSRSWAILHPHQIES